MNKKTIEDFFHDRLSPEQNAEVEEWLADNAFTPHADRLLDGLLEQISTDGHRVDVNGAFRRLRARIASSLQNGSKYRLRNLPGRMARMAVAAAVIISFIAIPVYDRLQRHKPVEWLEVHTGAGQSRKVTLPDKSTVWLNANSKLIYPRKFNHYFRQVYMMGEAYADVVQEKKRPFVLSGGEVNIRVLGTKFNVRSYLEDAQVEVTLVEGSIELELSLQNNITAYRLKPGDVVCVEKHTGQISKQFLDPQGYRNWSNSGGLYFRDQTLKDITNYLERYFNCEIVITDPELLGDIYYAIFINNENLDQILSTLNSTGNMKINTSNGIIYISKANKRR